MWKFYVLNSFSVNFTLRLFYVGFLNNGKWNPYFWDKNKMPILTHLKIHHHLYVHTCTFMNLANTLFFFLRWDWIYCNFFSLTAGVTWWWHRRVLRHRWGLFHDSWACFWVDRPPLQLQFLFTFSRIHFSRCTFPKHLKVLLTNFHLAQQLVSHSKCTKTTKSLHTYLREIHSSMTLATIVSQQSHTVIKQV